MNKKPKVSVLMAVYNGETFLSETIDSILNQTYQNFEFIIINDSSTDNTSHILENYSKKDPRIKITTNKKNQGLPKSLNIGLNLAKADYIARIDSDDIALPMRLERQVVFLDQNPHITVLGTWYYEFNDNNLIEQRRPTCHKIIKRTLYYGNPMAHPTVMFRKNHILDVGGYNEAIKYSQDYDLWWRLTPKYNLTNLPEFLLKYRVHPKSISVAHSMKQNEIHMAIKRKNYFKAAYLTKGRIVWESITYRFAVLFDKKNKYT